MKIEISSLRPDEWDQYRKIRLEALENEPQAFESNYKDVFDRPGEAWVEQLEMASQENRDIILFATVDNQVVGMAGAFFNKSEETERSAQIWGVYVSREYRRKGIGKQLVEKLLEKLSFKLDLQTVWLEVRPTQEAAINLYRQMGFRISSMNEGSIKMEKALS